MDNQEIKTKRCSKCGRFLPLADFNKCSSASDGLQNYCKDCQKEMYAEYRVKNKVKIEAYRQANKEKIKAMKKEYYQSNKDAILKKSAEYYQANKDKIAEYYQANKDAILKQQAEYRQANKDKIAEYKAAYIDPQTHPMNWARNMVNAYRQMDRDRFGDDSQTITAEWFLEHIAYRQCAHCGKQGIGLVGCNRLDNTKGHTEDNVEAACFKCNAKENIRDQLARGLHWTCKRKARHKTA